MLPEFIALETYRLERNLDWQALATEMASAATLVPQGTLYYWCKDRAPQGTVPRDRTLHQVRKFLADVVVPSGSLSRSETAALSAHLAGTTRARRATTKARRAPPTASPPPSSRPGTPRSSRSAHP